MRALPLVVLLVVAACESPSTGVTPPAPSLRLDRSGPSQSQQVTVFGTSPTGSTIELFLDAACATAAVSSVGSDQLAFGTPVRVNANTTTWISARANLEGMLSPCSPPVAFVHDGLAPPSPALAVITAVSSMPPRVRLEGAVTAGTHVRVFANGTCAGTAVKDVAEEHGLFSVELDVAANAETVFSADALDVAGNASPCSLPISFTQDTTPPSPPSLALQSAGPSQDLSATVVGTAEPRCRVQFFVEPGCRTTPVGETVAAVGTGAFSKSIGVERDTVTSLYAVAIDASNNRSACAGPVAFVNDSTAPQLPYFSSTSPVTPSRTATSFTISVSAEFGAVISLFTSADCSGASTTQRSFTVAANSRLPLSARAVDEAGNVSGCSLGPVLENDGVSPPAPTLTGSQPASPSRTTSSPQLLGLAEALGTLRVFASTDCTGTAATSTVGTNGQFAMTVSATSNGSRTFSATVSDRAGNVSPCSAPFTYTHDNRAPTTPVFFGTLPASPSNSTAPIRVVGTTEAGAQVQLFTGTSCTGVPLTGTVGPLINSAGVGTFSVSVTPTQGATTSFVALAVDAAGNTSACTPVALTFTQGARGWGEELALGWPTGTHAFPEVALVNGGVGVALFNHVTTAPEGVFRSELTQGAWASPTLVSDPAETSPYLTSPPRLVTDASGTALAAFTLHSTAQVVRRAADGSWSSQVLGTSDYGRTPAVALDGAGNGVTAWERFVTSTVRVLARRSTGATWAAEAQLSDSNVSSFEPRAAMSSTGRAVVAFAKNTGSGSSPRDELWTSVGEVGAAFGVATQRTSASLTSFDRRDARVGMNSAGESTLLWLQGTQLLGPWSLTSAATASGSWGTASTMPSTSTLSRRDFQLEVLPSGEAVAVWVSNAGALTFARRLVGGTWSAPSVIPGATGGETRLVSDSTGRFVVAWRSVDTYGNGAQLWVSSFVGNQWSAPQLIDVGLNVGETYSLAADAQGRVLVAWSRALASGERLLRTRTMN